jgi:hypothetical protein
MPPLRHLSEVFTCIDRREAGQSGGRVEHVTCSRYVTHGRGLLDELGFDKAYLNGGCMGCCPVAAFIVAYAETVLSMTLLWPVGGARYRLTNQQRFATHFAFVRANGLAAAEFARAGKSFGAGPRGGPRPQ